MSKELELIAEHADYVGPRGDRRCTCGWHSGVNSQHSRLSFAAHVVAMLSEHGYSILSNDQVREMIGPSREVDSCLKCSETVAWEQNAYDLRDNDDHRYSWVAYCETCSLHLELNPFPNPPIAAAAAAEEDQ